MATDSLIPDVDLFDLSSENTWEILYPLLKSFARGFVYMSHIPSWQGQESDIIEDIIQETCRRIIEHSQKAARGEAPPIRSLKRMLFVVARNYCTDLCRHDSHLLHMPQQNDLYHAHLDQTAQGNPAEVSIENVYKESLFRLAACEVAAFPLKQRRAILIDLARRMYFGKQLTALQQAFLDAGIDLREYRQALPSNPQEKIRHGALVSYAYRRIASLRQMQEYIVLA